MASKGGKADSKDDADAGGGKKKLMIIVGAVVAALVLGGGAFFMFMKPSGAEAAAEEPPPVPGYVLALEPITINLQDKHYLKFGMTLQLTKAAGKLKDGSHALDLAIETFTMQKQEDLHDAAHREKLRQELSARVSEAYEKKVMAVYFTEFVTQ